MSIKFSVFNEIDGKLIICIIFAYDQETDCKVYHQFDIWELTVCVDKSSLKEYF